ncbi:MAG: 16S rRNA (guanine(527)-N(7))-methyltransferase RsmG [Pseudomonadota bacterium]
MAKPGTRSSIPAPLTELFARGLTSLRLTMAGEHQAALLYYIALLNKWNRVYNLTAVVSQRDMVTRHLLDSLAVVPEVQGPRILDVGSGPGLPGIPLAVALPGLHFSLLDSVAKKTRFIVQAVGELGLANVEVETRRLETYQPAELFDTVISRAFSGVGPFIAAAGRLCRPGGVMLAMKGRDPTEEAADLPHGFRVENILRLRVPGLDEERHLVRVRRDV